MELRDRAAARLTGARLAATLLAALALLLIAGHATTAPAPAAELEQPASETEPPARFERSAREVKAIAARAGAVRDEARERGRRLAPTAYTKGLGRWQVSFFDRGDEVAQVLIDDRTGAVLEAWRGPQVAWSMARGYDGAFGRKLNAPYVWLALCALFLLPFVDPRRPFRLLHLDLLVLLGLGVSHAFFNRGEIGISVPLVVPVLAYLLVRCLCAGLRPRERPGRLGPLARPGLLAVGIVFLVAFRVGLNVVDSNVIDVGYAGVIGADRIADGDELYGDGFSRDVARGDTYGPLTYVLYVPFEQALPWSGRWDDLPAAHAAAIVFDLLALLALMLLGRRLRPGREGVRLGLALGWAWAAYPYTAFALETNANDALVALLLTLALLGLTLDARRPGLSAAARAAALALGAAAKFAPLLLAPLFAGAGERRRARGAVLFGLVFVGVLAVSTLPFLPDGGPRELYDRTVGYQASRPSPFSPWGQAPSLEWLQTALKGLAAALAVAFAFVPRRKGVRQVAALAAALLVLLQLTASYWFYLYTVWFVPFVLLVVLGALRPAAERGAAPRLEAEPTREPVVA